MNFNKLLMMKIVSLVTMLLGISMIPSFIVALIYNESSSAWAFAISAILLLSIGACYTGLTKEESVNTRSGEGYFLVLVVWILACFLGALPYYFAGQGFTLVDSIFESTSGFTTTGSFVIEPDALSKSLLFWKASTHWLGGMGILILMVSLFPFLGISGVNIATAEAPGPTFDKTKARVSETTRFLYISYIIFSVAECIMLSFSGMNLYDCLISTMASISTGGLFITESIAPFMATGYVRGVIILFTIISSINFVVYYNLINKNFKAVTKNIELRVFLLIIAISSLSIGIYLYATGIESDLGQALGDALFESTAASSTSGYAAIDYFSWPSFAQFVLVIQMLIGSCASSTGGALKVIRVVVLFKLIKRGLYKRIHPNAVKTVKLSGQSITTVEASNITLFSLIYFGTLLFAVVFLSIDNLDFVTTFTSAVSLLSNSGMTFGDMGFTCDFSNYSTVCKYFLSLLMMAGRLEIYSVILIFTRSFWKQDKANY
ncbi:MAG: TrkH family potassium uptake protein [Clostridia bacterium]|nr:TrkH family potassium uptake protein [Clostridia bacterium]